MVKKVSIWSTLEPLLYNKELHLAEISKKLNKPHTTVRKQLEMFEKMGLVEKRTIGKLSFYKLKKIPLIIDYLTIIEKEKLIRRCNEELALKEIVEFFHNFNNPMIIFGSAVRSLKEANDIDLIILGKFNSNSLIQLEKKLNIKFHILNVKTLKQINEALKKEIIKKHLIIQGSEEWIKWMIN